MLAREHIEPHFGAAREALPQGDALRAGGLRAAGRSRDWTASPAVGRPRPLRGLRGLPGLRRLREVPRLGRWSKRDALAALIGIGAAAAIAANALMLQPGPHPAPIFAIKSKPAPPPAIAHSATGTTAEAMAQLPRSRPAEIAKPGPTSEPAPTADGVPLPRQRPRSRPQSPPNTAAHADPIADIIDPARQVGAVQRVLNEFGYGPINVSGTFDDDTRNAIARFERDHNLPVTGQNSPRLRQALRIATGRILE
jgi:hypothetical protein